MTVAIGLAGCGGQVEEAPASAGSAEYKAAASRPLAAMNPVAASAAAESPHAQVSGDEFAHLRQQLALLQREVGEIRRHLGRNAAVVASATSALPDARTDENARAQAQRTEQLRLASTESAFRREEYDPRWSQGTADSVRAALAEADEQVRGQVRSIECRASSCRVEISMDSQGPLGLELPMILDSLGSTLPNMTAGQIQQGDGRQATVLYFSR